MRSKGGVFNIQRFSIHDGPGIRTTVFLKGCTLSCFWCHNPEGRNPRLEIQFFPDRCIACGACVTACPNSAHELRDGMHIYYRDRCEVSGRCVETCYSQALQVNGQLMTVEQVMEEVLRDSPFYIASGGGVTLSGGEPSLSSVFARELLEQCKNHSLHTAIETCGECPWAALEALLPLTDLVIMDIKHIDQEKHRAATGKSNSRILENAHRLAQTDKPIVFRTPVVPTVNDSDDEIREIASFVRNLLGLRAGNGKVRRGNAAITYELLSFHKLASYKYSSLGLEYKASIIQPLPHQRMVELVNFVKRQGVEAQIR